MKIAYFDCFSGAGGDMILGALVDAGLDFDHLQAEIAQLGLTHYRLYKVSVCKRGLGATQVVVEVDQHRRRRRRRHLADIEAIIDGSGLAVSVKRKSLSVFRRLAEAEAKVHRTSIEKIHFHELGAVDTIIDVVGALVGFEALAIEKLYCSSLPLGSGTVECAHGTLPVPAPATAELVRGCPVYSSDVDGELLTPTGAAILTTLAEGFGPMPTMKVEQIGYGAGTTDRPVANLLRVMIGHMAEQTTPYDVDQVAVVETNIDDMNPQMYDFVLDRLLDEGVKDVFLTPVLMKKNRPATCVTVICAPDSVADVCDLLMKETTSIGVRWRMENRFKARREISEVPTPYGTVRVKICRAGRQIINAAPEYDDCKKRALEHRVSLQEVMISAENAIAERIR